MHTPVTFFYAEGVDTHRYWVYCIHMTHTQGFSDRLKRARLARGLSQAAIGRLIGKARCTITNYERGVGHPPLETLAELAVVLHVRVDTLLGLRKVYNREKSKESRLRKKGGR